MTWPCGSIGGGVGRGAVMSGARQGTNVVGNTYYRGSSRQVHCGRVAVPSLTLHPRAESGSNSVFTERARIANGSNRCGGLVLGAVRVRRAAVCWGWHGAGHVPGGFRVKCTAMRGELLEAERVHLEHELRARGHDIVLESMVDVSYRGQHVAWQRRDPRRGQRRARPSALSVPPHASNGSHRTTPNDRRQ